MYKILSHTVVILIFIQSFSVIGQTSNPVKKIPVEADQILFAESSENAKNLAEYDIKQGTPFLFIVDGVGSVIFEKDKTFENTFNVKYYHLGCISPGSSILEAYNYTVFDFLDKKYGKKWPKLVRKDVEGFKKWKKKH